MEYMPVIIDAKYITDYKIKIIFNNGKKDGWRVKYSSLLKIRNIFKNSLWMVGIFHGQT
jgi:hypothetical protein